MIGELQVPHWQWLIILYFFVGGVAGGAYFTSAIIELVGGPDERPIARMGYLVAFPLALLCATFLILDLGHPERFWHMIVYRKTLLPWPVWTSAISMGAYALLLFGLFSFLSFLDVLVEIGRLPWAPLRERYSGSPRLVYAILGAIVGFFLASYTGVLISTTHLPMWTSTPLLGALFVASGASTGMAAIAVGLSLTKTSVTPTAWNRLKQADNLAILVDIVLLIAFLALASVNGFTWTILNMILLVGGTLIIGLVVPLILQFTPRFGRLGSAAVVTTAALLILLGGLILRAAIVLGGQGLL